MDKSEPDREAAGSKGDAEEKNRLIDLMMAYQAGEVGAFEELYQLLKPRLYQYLIVRTLDRTWAEELLQETFLQIHRSRRTYLPRRPVSPWAFAISRHVFLMAWRSRCRRRSREEPLEDELPDLPVPPDADGWTELSQVWQALRELPSDQREALLLHHYHGLSFREIGGVLGIRAGTAKLRAHRGLLRLRQRMEADSVTAGRKQAITYREPLDS